VQTLAQQSCYHRPHQNLAAAGGLALQQFLGHNISLLLPAEMHLWDLVLCVWIKYLLDSAGLAGR